MGYHQNLKRMKIGVITFSFSKDNYGQILQCYSLQKFLINMNQDAFLIKYDPKPQDAKPQFKPQNIIKYLSNFKLYLQWWLNNNKERNNHNKYNQDSENTNRGFNDFFKKFINCTELYTAKSLTENPPHADIYVCGSDQIWGTGGDWPFYLSFVPEGKKRIAYAPSMGGISKIPEDVKPIMTSLLAKFTFIGMREQSGKETLTQLGIPNVTTVIDPTMLLTSEDYSKIAKMPERDGNYIFVYFLGKPSECDISEIYHFAESHGIDVVYVASGGKIDKYPKTYASIEEWIGYIAKAKFVITNSFHCTVFALLYNKPFSTILLNKGYERMNCRVEELLRECDLSERIYRGNISSVLSSDIDFSGFNSYRKRYASASGKLLMDAILE